MATESGVNIAEGADLVNLPRHPSQLYEALFEGVGLWLFLWFVIRPRSKYRGAAIVWYLIGYGVARFFIEYTREPDKGLGYVVQFGPANAPNELFVSFLNFTTGQVFCLLMIFAGVVLHFLFKFMSKRNDPMAEFASTMSKSETEKAEQRKARRKTKKKLG
jgi:phosphatidylglycerol---prolipoprotein diacylglyceryl transferase